MKKAIILSSCALLSTPLFAKGFIEHITQVKKHKILQFSTHVDFSGHWVGHCGFEDKDENVAVDIQQSDNKLSVAMQYEHTPDELKFKQDYIFNTAKLESNSSPKNLEHVMSYAEWQSENTVLLDFHRYSFLTDGTENNYSFRMISWSMFGMSLEGDKLNLFNPFDNDEESTCVFHKEG